MQPYPFFVVIPEGLALSQIEAWATMLSDWGVSAYFAGARALFRTLDDAEASMVMLAETIAGDHDFR